MDLSTRCFISPALIDLVVSDLWTDLSWTRSPTIEAATNTPSPMTTARFSPRGGLHGFHYDSNAQPEKSEADVIEGVNYKRED